MELKCPLEQILHSFLSWNWADFCPAKFQVYCTENTGKTIMDKDKILFYGRKKCKNLCEQLE